MADKPQVDWNAIVEQIRQGDPAGEEALYENLLTGARLFLQRRLGKHDVDDQVHDLFVTIIETIRRGGLHYPERLMGFVRTVLYRQLNLEISTIIRARETNSAIEMASQLAGSAGNPEEELLSNEKLMLMRQVLRTMESRDFEVLTRFYLRDQDPTRICVEMGLTPTQFQLLKSRAKAHLADLVRRKLRRKRINRQ
jgi:RNA polymerase sigma-70 factor, ECF subfamily